MRCKVCGTKIEGSMGVCPLCGAPASPQTPVYPPRKVKARTYIVPFTKVYLFVALALSVVLVTLNVVYTPQVHYWLLLLVGLWYLYFSLRHSILGIENVYYKLWAQSVAMLVVLGVCGWVLDFNEIFVWGMPALYALVWLAAVIVTVVRPHISKQFVVSLWAQSMLGAVLPLLCWAFHVMYIPALSVAGLQLLTGIIITIVHPKEVWSQLVREFDK